MAEIIELEKIDANPWQPRHTEDGEHIAKLAASISTSGLLQTPLARPHPTAKGRWQLAFGHSRVAAYRKLNRDANGMHWSAMPLEVRELTDRQMSDMAASENAQRKDLTAIETAQAIAKRIKDFKLTQLEAGAPFGYTSQSAISNLLRLLKLPKEVQADVASGALPERLARQLVTVAGIEGAEQDVKELAKHVAARPVEEREEALTDGIDSILHEHGRDLDDAPFELDWPEVPIPVEHKGGDRADVPAELRKCTGCPFFFKAGYAARCMNVACFELKSALGMRNILADAAQRLGIPQAAVNEVAYELSVRSYDEVAYVRMLIEKSKKSHNAFQLRVMLATPEQGYYNANITNDKHVAIGTLEPKMCEAFLKQLKNAGKENAATVAKQTDPTDTVANKQAETEAAEARRAERGAALRNEADCYWLVTTVTASIAPALTMSGQTLQYVVERIMRRHTPNSVYGLQDWYNGLEERAEKATGKDADVLRRQMFVAQQIFDLCLQSYNDVAFDTLRDGIVDLVEGDIDEVGLGGKFEKNWDRAPIHRTVYNCWHCGEFAGQRGRLTQGDNDRGWATVTKGDETLDVKCPECSRKKTTPAATAKKARK
jgi:ParB family chromosome partitioning protein